MTAGVAADVQGQAVERAPEQRSRFRGDVEGLRAVAVGLVLLDHVLGWPVGGFVGVDVFFVISGFLITGLLVRERESTGRLSIRAFYVRRVRRLFPAAFATLGATCLVAGLLFTGDRRLQILIDSAWAALFSANINFASQGTDYFRADTAPSPVQHFWSLAVEEQFYLVWPTLIIALFAVRVVRASRRRLLLLLAMSGVGVASFAWSLYATSTSPETAYFSTFTRAWELAVGAVVALAITSLERFASPLRAALAWIGLAAVVVSAFIIDDGTPFPGSAAALPVVATALLLGFGNAPGGPGVRWALGSQVARYLGRISYSLYLWHWPVVVILASLLTAGSTLFITIAVGLSLVLATVSYYVIEQPVLHSNWLLTRGKNDRPKNAPQVFERAKHVGFAFFVAAGVTFITLGLMFPPGRIDPSVAAAAQEAQRQDEAAEDAGQGEVLDPLTKEIRDALLTPTWEKLDPPLDQLGEQAMAPEWQKDGCLDVREGNMDDCLYGDPAASQRAVLLGDSIAISWLPGLREQLQPDGWAIQNMTFQLCPNVNAPALLNGAAYPECAEHREWAIQQMESNPPDLVILSNSYRAELDVDDGEKAAAWETGLTDTLTRLVATGARVVVVGMTPGIGVLDTCVTAVSSPADCVRAPIDEFRQYAPIEERVAGQTGAAFVDPQPWFCYEGRCPAVVGTTPVYAGGSHITAAYARKIGPQLAAAVTGKPNA